MALAFPKPDVQEPEVQADPAQQSALFWGKRDWLTALPYGAAAILLAALAWPTLRFWNYEYTKPESYYQHAPLIPFLAALMLWHRRDALKAVLKAPAPAALLLLLPALALLVFATKIQAEALESTGLLLTITSSVWLVLGGRFVRAAAFPLGFLWLMAPLPGPVLNDSTQRMQMASTVLGDRLLHLMTFPTTRVGSVIEMENYSLWVDVPCSGFKLLLSLLTFSAAFAFLVDGSPARRLGLFLFSLPLALLVNSVRVALIGVVGECVGASAAHVFHDWSGLIVLVLGFFALFGLAKGLGCRTFAGWAIF